MDSCDSGFDSNRLIVAVPPNCEPCRKSISIASIARDKDSAGIRYAILNRYSTLSLSVRRPPGIKRAFGQNAYYQLPALEYFSVGEHDVHAAIQKSYAASCFSRHHLVYKIIARNSPVNRC